MICTAYIHNFPPLSVYGLFSLTQFMRGGLLGVYYTPSQTSMTNRCHGTYGHSAICQCYSPLHLTPTLHQTLALLRTPTLCRIPALRRTHTLCRIPALRRTHTLCRILALHRTPTLRQILALHRTPTLRQILALLRTPTLCRIPALHR